MKPIIIVIVSIFFIFVLFQSYTLLSANKTEEQKYTVVKHEKDFEIRFYPAAYNESNLPKPNDADVIISKTNDEYVAVIRFGGYASDDDLKFYSEKLQNLLKVKGFTTYGHYRYLGYNPPYQVVNRKNEIIVSIKWN